MKVLTAIPAAPDTTGGGVRAGIQLSRALKARDGVTLRLYKMEGFDEGLFNYGDIEPFYLPPKEGLASTFSKLTPFPKRYTHPFIGCELTTQFKQEDPDIIHVHNSLPVRGLSRIVNYANDEGIAILLTTHGLRDKLGFPQHGDLSFIARAAYKSTVLKPYVRALRNVDGLVALTESDRTFLKKLTNSSQIYLSSNGVSDSVYSPEPDFGLLDKYNLSSPLVLFVGSITNRKGIRHLSALSKKLDEGTLAIVGPTKDRSTHDRLQAEFRADRASLLGYVPDRELYDLYALSDVFVLPTEQDTFPLVVLEAMVNRTPVVATDVGAIARQVGNGGIAVKDPADVPSVVNNLIHDRSRLERMSKAARQRATESFSWTAIANEHLTIYRDVIATAFSSEQNRSPPLEP